MLATARSRPALLRGAIPSSRTAKRRRRSRHSPAEGLRDPLLRRARAAARLVEQDAGGGRLALRRRPRPRRWRRRRSVPMSARGAGGPTLQLVPVREPAPARSSASAGGPFTATRETAGLLAGRPVGHHLRGDQRDQRIDHQRKQHHHRQGAAVAQRLAQLLPGDEQDLSRRFIRRRSRVRRPAAPRTAGTPPPGWGPHRPPRAGRRGVPSASMPPRYIRPMRSQSSSASAR